MKFKEKLKKNKKKIIILLFFVVIILLLVKPKNSDNTQSHNEIETEAITRRTIASSISSTGTIKAEDSKTITSVLTGFEIKTVNVTEGQIVNAGDTICTFDMKTVKESLSDAQKTAEISNEQSNLNIEAAQKSVKEAYAQRDASIVAYQQQVVAAESAYNSAVNSLSDLQSKLEEKQKELSTFEQSVTNSVSNSVSTSDALKQEILALQESIKQLQNTIPSLKATYESSVAALNSTTAQADSAVKSAQEGVNDQIKNAQLAADASKIQTNAGIRQYNQQLEKGILTAPISGTVTSLNIKNGDIYTGGEIATISTCNNLYVEAQIDEYDIADVKPGMSVLIKTDSTRDEELQGIVTYVALNSTNLNANSSLMQTSSMSNSNATYTVKIALTNQNERLRLGMNAKISIITNKKEDVLTVPYDAIYKKEDGTNYVEIAQNGDVNNKKQVNVTIGIEGTYYTEVISNELTENMQVILPQRDVSNSIEELINSMGADAGM